MVVTIPVPFQLGILKNIAIEIIYDQFPGGFPILFPGEYPGTLMTVWVDGEELFTDTNAMFFVFPEPIQMDPELSPQGTAAPLPNALYWSTNISQNYDFEFAWVFDLLLFTESGHVGQSFEGEEFWVCQHNVNQVDLAPPHFEIHWQIRDIPC